MLQPGSNGAFVGPREPFAPDDPKNEVRLGGTRPALPSYEGERMLTLMERIAWEWPQKARSPPRLATTTFCDNIGRLEPLIAYGGANATRRAAPGLRPSRSLPVLPRSRPEFKVDVRK